MAIEEPKKENAPFIAPQAPPMPEGPGITPTEEGEIKRGEATALGEARRAIDGETGGAKPEQEQSLTPEKINFDEKNFTLLLDLDKSAVDLAGLRESANKNGFEQKDEFHITVLGFKNGGEIKKILKKMTPEQKQDMLAKIKALVDETDWSFKFEPQKYHIAKDYKTADPKNKGAEITEHRESYIQTISLPGIESFYKKLNILLGTSMEPPPAHITLFTGGSDKEKAKMGIGINSQEELKKLNSKEI